MIGYLADVFGEPCVDGDSPKSTSSFFGASTQTLDVRYAPKIFWGIGSTWPVEFDRDPLKDQF